MRASDLLRLPGGGDFPLVPPTGIEHSICSRDAMGRLEDRAPVVPIVGVAPHSSPQALWTARRSMLAKSLGLGRKVAEPVAPAKRQKTSPPGIDAAGTSKAKRARGSRSAPKSNGGTAALTSAGGKRSRARVASPDTRPQTDIQRSHVIREPPLPPRPSGSDRARSAPPGPRWSSRSRSASRIRPRRPRRRLAW